MLPLKIVDIVRGNLTVAGFSEYPLNSVQVQCTGTVYRYSVQVLCTATVYRYSVQVQCRQYGAVQCTVSSVWKSHRLLVRIAENRRDCGGTMGHTGE